MKMKALINFLKDENGASAAEYGLLVALIAVVIVVGVKGLGTKLGTTFTTVTGDL